MDGIQEKLKIIRQRFLKIFAFWSERVTFEDGVVDFVIFVYEEKLSSLKDYLDEILA